MDEIVKKRLELQNRLKGEFPEAEITVKSYCEREIAVVKLNGSYSPDAADKIGKIREKALREPFIQMRPNNGDSGFLLEGPSPNHLLAMLQE